VIGTPASPAPASINMRTWQRGRGLGDRVRGCRRVLHRAVSRHAALYLGEASKSYIANYEAAMDTEQCGARASQQVDGWYWLEGTIRRLES
jgi:hypothetical protein